MNKMTGQEIRDEHRKERARVKVADREKVIAITYADGWKYEAKQGKCKPQRLMRILTRLRNGVNLESALMDMPQPERVWVTILARARALYEREVNTEAAAKKVEAWKAKQAAEVVP